MYEQSPCQQKMAGFKGFLCEVRPMLCKSSVHCAAIVRVGLWITGRI